MTTGSLQLAPFRDWPGEPEHELATRMAADVRRLFRVAGIVTVALVAGVGGWASLSSISGAVVAAATIAIDGKRKTVQHLDGGRIATIHVRDGALVEAGAPLVTLESRELEDEVAAMDREIAARSRQVALIEGDLIGLLELQSKGLVPNSRVTTLQRDAAGLAADLARLASQKARVSARLERVVVVAPVSGWVHNMVTHTIGGVVVPGAAIAEIVPSTSGLLVEAKVAPGDIDQVRQGQRATIRMTSFNQRSTPTLDSRVEHVSADLMRDDAKGIQYYLARLSLPAEELRRLGGKSLVPGMPVDAMIETDRRSVMSYLTKPLTDQFARAFREE